MVMNDKRISKDRYANSPVVWFVVLERARQDNNFKLAAKARQELDRLGVIVKYRRLATLRQQGGNNDR
jgi:hypothetical protein